MPYRPDDKPIPRTPTPSEVWYSNRAASAQRVNVVLLVLNVIGVVRYVVRASLSWAIPQEQGLDSATGEPFIWAIAVLPILAVFLLLDLTWGAVIVGFRQWRSGRLWLLSALIWLAAIALDFVHH